MRVGAGPAEPALCDRPDRARVGRSAAPLFSQKDDHSPVLAPLGRKSRWGSTRTFSNSLSRLGDLPNSSTSPRQRSPSLGVVDADDGWPASHPTTYWHALDDGRIQCDVCPRACKLREGQRGLCFVRGASRATRSCSRPTAGRAGFCVDPIEKKPLNHFLPGTPVLSFGTAGCNLACRFCQNWDISKSQARSTRWPTRRRPRRIAARPRELGCRSVAFTYNDPAIFLEYAIDVADACRERRRQGGRGHAPATSAPSPGAEFYAPHRRGQRRPQGVHRGLLQARRGRPSAAGARHAEYLRHETDVWFEITTLLIPGHNDSDAELDAMTRVDRRAPRARRAAALHRVPSRLQDARHAAARRPRRCTRARDDRACATGCATSTPATCTTATARARTARAAARW